MSDWPRLKFQELAATDRASFSVGPFGSAITKENYVPYGVPVVRGINLSKGRFLDDEFVYITEEKADELANANLAPGDMVFTHRGTIGQVSLIPHTPRFDRYVLSSSQVKARLDISRAIPEFYYYWFRSPEGRQVLLANASTVGVPGIASPLATIKSLQVPLPPRAKQYAISSALVALDDKIESNSLAIRIASQLAGAIFEATFEQQGSAGLARLGALADVIDCLHSRKPPFVTSGHRYLVLADIRDDSRLEPLPRFTISNEDYINWTRRIEAREGDCLLTNVGRVGAVGQIPQGVRAAIGRNMTAIRGHKECPPAYLVEALRSATVRREIDVKTDQGTVMSALNVRSIPNLMIPGSHIQDRRNFQDKAGGLHELQDRLLQENARLAIMRDTLLPRLMSGEIRVRDAERIVEDAT